MRITNFQKTQLIKNIQDWGIQEDFFEFNGENDIFQVKFKENYFTFHIKMTESDLYESTVSYVNQQTPHTIAEPWHQTLKQFNYWMQGIADDIKHDHKFFKKVTVDFPTQVVNYSAAFPAIYNQALTAETNNLTEICGLGYRKAFEFLIRDYLLKKHPESEHNDIKTLPASQCVDKYVTSDEIKLLAHRVFWLGNDHAHYLKKWEDMNVEDMKKLINLTIKWISIRDELEIVKQSMPSGKK